MADIAVLLRNGTHAAATIRYALKCSDFSVQVTKTPIQIPIPLASPELIDIGVFRPSLTITGLVDNGAVNTNVPGSPDNSMGVEGMEAVAHTSGGSSKNYYIPYKNKMEEVAYKWLFDDTTGLELEVGNATYPVYAAPNHATGGGVYKVAIQQARFQINAAKEDRWEFTMQFVCKARDGISFPASN